MDLRDIVKNRKNECRAIDDNFLPPQSGANESDFFGRSAVKGPYKPNPHRDDDYRDNNRQNDPSVNSHGTPPTGYLMLDTGYWILGAGAYPSSPLP